MNRLYRTAGWSLLLGAVSIGTGVVSYKFKSSNHYGVPYLNAVSTGVILAAAFVHLLPDALHDLQEFHYPVAMFSSMVGFLLMVVVEAILQFSGLQAEHKAATTEHLNHDCSIHEYELGADPVHHRQGGVPSSAFTSNMDCGSSASSVAHAAVPKRTTELTPLTADSNKLRKHSITAGPSPSGVFSLWLALSVHSLMEGFGVGVTQDALQQSTIVFAILIHKGFASLALANALLDSHLLPVVYVPLFMFFALASPLGAIIACIIDTSSTSSVLAGVITALAAGSFMYIGTMEMLPQMLNTCKNMLFAIFLFVASALAMAALAATAYIYLTDLLRHPSHCIIIKKSIYLDIW